MISKRKLESYKRSEKVARELRHLLCIDGVVVRENSKHLLCLLNKWMHVTGKIKYERPS